MTTIATDGRVLAADRKVTSRDGTVFYTTKICRIDGSLFGGAGDESVDLVLTWIRCGCLPDDRPALAEDSDWSLLELRKRGEIWLWDKCLVPMRVLDKRYAIGSGGLVALYAMKVLKLRPRDAVLEACKVDDASGGGVDVEAV